MYKRDTLGRRLFRFKRFGVRVILLDYLSRRFGLERLQEWVRLRMNVIEESHIK